MTIDQIHLVIDQRLRKVTGGGFLSPEEKDREINRAQYELFEQVKPKYGISQQVHDLLRPFLKNLTLNNGNTTGGIVTLPTDYYHLNVISSVVNDAHGNHYIPVEMVNPDEVDYRLSDQLVPVDAYNPIGLFDQSGAVQVFPAQPFAGTVRYLRKPAECKFSYTTNTRGITYVPDTSVQLEWNESGIIKIIDMAIERLALNTQDPTAIQLAQAKEAANQ